MANRVRPALVDEKVYIEFKDFCLHHKKPIGLELDVALRQHVSDLS